MRGSDDPHVGGDRPRGADGHDLALLQDAQHCGLCRWAQVADLVEEECAAFRGAYEARLIPSCSREGPPLVAEEERLDERSRQGTAVDANEGARARRLVVNGAGEYLLAGACLSEKQDGDVRACDARQHLQIADEPREQRSKGSGKAAQIGRVDVARRVDRRKQLGPVPEKGLPNLDEIAVGKGDRVHLAPVHARAVGRAAVG
jgi:hypothetical protein